MLQNTAALFLGLRVPTFFLNSDNSDDSVSRLSINSFIVLLNSDPIFAHSKKHRSCEILSFGSEFIAIKSFCECL